MPLRMVPAVRLWEAKNTAAGPASNDDWTRKVLQAIIIACKPTGISKCATLLHLLGFDHTKLTYRFHGRDFRLTDVFGEVVDKLVA